MANTVSITFAGDSKSLEKTFDKVGAGAKDMAADMDKAASQAKGLDSAVGKVGDTVDSSESKFMGTADVLDGLAATVGLNIDRQIELARGFGDIAGGLTNLRPLFAGIIGKIGAMVGITGAQTAATVGATGAQTGLNAALMANPIGAVVLAIGVLVGAFILAWKTSETFRDIIKGAFEVIKDVLGPIGSVIGKVVGFIGDLFNKTEEEVTDHAKQTQDRLKEINDALEAQRNKWQSWKDGVANAINGILNPLQNARDQSKVGFDEINKNLIDNTKFFEGWINNLTLLTNRGFGDLAQEMFKLGPSAEKAVGEMVTKTDAQLTTMTHRFGLQGVAADRAFTGAFLSNEGLQAMGNAGVQYGIQFKKAFDSSLTGHVNIPINRVGPSIPQLADGGIVRGPTLAVIGEAGPEAVVPLNKMSSMGGGGPIIVNVAGSVATERGIVDAIHEGLLSKQRRSGTLGFDVL